MIKVHINGEEKNLPAGLSVSGLFVELGMTEGRVAIEKNEKIVPKSTFDNCFVEDGDKLEIVHFIGGG